MRRWWDRLGDDELWARLTQRGMAQRGATAMVRHRDSCSDCRAEIHHLLGDE